MPEITTCEQYVLSKLDETEELLEKTKDEISQLNEQYNMLYNSYIGLANLFLTNMTVLNESSEDHLKFIVNINKQEDVESLLRYFPDLAK